MIIMVEEDIILMFLQNIDNYADTTLLEIISKINKSNELVLNIINIMI